MSQKGFFEGRKGEMVLCNAWSRLRRFCQVKQVKKLSTSLVVVLVVASCQGSQDPKNREKATLGVSKSFLSIPAFVAKSTGYFSREGIDLTVKECSSGKTATDALFRGEADISTVADMPVVLESFKRKDFCIFGTFCRSYRMVKLIARKDSGIRTGADLKGKKVGVNLGTSSHFFLGAFLMHHMLSVSDIKMVNMRTVDMPVALRNNQVDAISVWQPYDKKALRLLGDNAVEFPAGEIYCTTFNLVTTKSFAKEHPEVLGKFLRAINNAVTFIQKNREISQDIIAKTFKLDIDSVRAAWDDFVFGLSLDQALLVSWEEIARWSIQNNFVPKREIPNYLNYICLGPLEAVKPESISIIH